MRLPGEIVARFEVYCSRCERYETKVSDGPGFNRNLFATGLRKAGWTTRLNKWVCDRCARTRKKKKTSEPPQELPSV